MTAVAAVAGIISAIIIIHENSTAGKFNIGVSGSPLLAPLYYAKNQKDWSEKFNLVSFDSSSDIGYALVSGKLQAAFMDPSKALLVKKFPGFREIDVVGKITYPYGAALVVRKGLHLKVKDLPGHTVAVSSESCNLYHAFKKDLSWLKVDSSKVKFAYVTFDAMLPALEAGKIDAALTKGSYALIAQKLGHAIPYLQWDIAAGDECCPAVVAQTEYLLLIRKDAGNNAEKLLQLLLETQNVNQKDLINAAASATGIPVNILESLPAPSFSRADAPLLQLFEDHEREENEEKAKSKKR